jgi:hypothetical protein
MAAQESISSDGTLKAFGGLKNSLSVEQPVAGDELRVVKLYRATPQDKCPGRSSSRSAASR